MFEDEKEATVATVREVAEVNLDRQDSYYIDIVEVYILFYVWCKDTGGFWVESDINSICILKAPL